VTKAQSNRLSGNLVIIKHSNSYKTYYGYLSKYVKGIKEGVKIHQGKVIGYVGMTGFTTGAHVDFKIRHNDNFFDFRKIKQSPATTLIGKDKKGIQKKI
jgi:murein DD-endopeptidase MepM/ murein hydrolase activator NlpD